MEIIKKIFNALPPYVWVIIALFCLVGFYWMSDDIGSWWEHRKQDKFDAKIEAQQQQIDELTKARDALLVKVQEAEAREQAKAVEADLLRQEAAKHGVNIAAAQKKIEDATQEYKTDLDFIEKVKSGDISKLELCIKQCNDSAQIGYPCRANYCDKFK